MKSNKAWGIIAVMAIIGICLTVTALAFGVNKNGVYFDKNGLHTYSEGYDNVRETGVEKITEIDIDILSGAIRFEKADTYGYEINFGKESGCEHSLKNGRFTVEQRAVSRMFSINMLTLNEYIIVYLPPDAALDTVKIKTLSGNVDINNNLICKEYNSNISSGKTNIENITADNVIIKSASGNINLSEAAAKSFDFDLKSGTLNADRLDSGKLTVKSLSGGVNISGKLKGETVIDASSGNAKIDIDGSEQQYNRDISALSGNIRVNDDKSSGGTVNYKADNNLKIKVLSGNIALNFKD